jgi:hypothetical protein
LATSECPFDPSIVPDLDVPITITSFDDFPFVPEHVFTVLIGETWAKLCGYIPMIVSDSLVHKPSDAFQNAL